MTFQLRESLRSGLRNTGYYTFSNIASSIVGVLAIPAVARMVSVSEFGQYDLFLLASNFFLIVSTLGMDSGMAIKIIENEGDRDALGFLLTFVVLSSFAFTILLWLSFLAFHRITGGAYLPFGIWMLVFLSVAFRTVSNHILGFLKWVESARSAAILNLLASCLGTLLGLVLLAWSADRNIVWFLYGLVAGNVFAAVASLYFSRGFLSFRGWAARKGFLRDLLHLSIPYIPTYIGNFFMQFIDRLIILNYLSGVELGMYAIVYRIGSIPTTLLSNIARGFDPLLYKACGDLEGKAFVRKYYHAYWLLLPVLVVFGTVFREWIVQVIGGSKYTFSSYLVPVSILSSMAFGSLYYNGLGYAIRRKTYYVTFLTIVAIAVNLAAGIFFVRYFGLFGVALGAVCASFAFSFLYTFLSERLFEVGYDFRIIGAAAVSSLFLILWIGLGANR